MLINSEYLTGSCQQIRAGGWWGTPSSSVQCSVLLQVDTEVESETLMEA